MHTEFDMREIRFHQYRMQVIERWPDGADKQAALSAARAVLLREAVFETEKCVNALDAPFSEAASSREVFADCAVD
jgi:hypothetical protein